MNYPFNQQYFKKLPCAFIILLLLFAGSLLLFSYITHQVFWNGEEALDKHLMKYISYNLETPGRTAFMKSITYFASAPFLQVAYPLLVVAYVLKKKIRRAMEVSIIGISSFLITIFLKDVFERKRPDDPILETLFNFSFPSGHASLGFIFYGTLAYLFWKSSLPVIYKYIISALLLLFSLLIGFSRVYLRMHYASDVIAGFCLGYIWLTFAVWLLERLKKKSQAEVHLSKRD